MKIMKLIKAISKIFAKLLCKIRHKYKPVRGKGLRLTSGKKIVIMKCARCGKIDMEHD